MGKPSKAEDSLTVTLRNQVSTFIAEQSLKPGDQLPTEAQLTAMFQVSRATLREALKLLEEDGMIYAVHGRGRFVSAMAAVRVERPITRFESITRMVRHYGYEPVNKVLSIAEEKPPDVVARALELKDGDRVIRLERLRMQHDEVILYCVDYVPRPLIADRLYDVDWTGSLVALLENRGHKAQMSRATATAMMLPREIVERNDLAEFGPALLITEIVFSQVGEPMIYALDYHRGSAFSFNFVRR